MSNRLPNDMDLTELKDDIRSLHVKLDTQSKALSSLASVPKDLTELKDDIRSLHVKLDTQSKALSSLASVPKTLSSLEKKVDDVVEVQQISAETVRKSANSINIVIRFLAGLRKLSPGELKTTLVEADAILNTVYPIPSNENVDETLEWNITKDKLKTILKEVFDLLNSLPLAKANNSVASTSTAYDDSKVEEDKIKFWRKYKNKYNYIEKLKPKLPPLNDHPVEELVSLQNNVKPIIQNDLNVNTQNNVIDTSQTNSNGETTYTIDDIIQNKEVYEMLKSRLKNSPYDDPIYKNNVVNSKLTLTLHNGETYIRPVSHVAPLIVLKKCDDLCPIPLQNKKTTDVHFQSTSNSKNHSSSNSTSAKTDVHFQSTSNSINHSSSNSTSAKTDEHFQSTSNSINDSNSNNTTAKMTKRETRTNKTKDITNSFSTNVKTTTKKRRSSIKNTKYEPSKKKKN